MHASTRAHDSWWHLLGRAQVGEGASHLPHPNARKLAPARINLEMQEVLCACGASSSSGLECTHQIGCDGSISAGPCTAAFPRALPRMQPLHIQTCLCHMLACVPARTQVRMHMHGKGSHAQMQARQLWRRCKHGGGVPGATLTTPSPATACTPPPPLHAVAAMDAYRTQ